MKVNTIVLWLIVIGIIVLMYFMGFAFGLTIAVAVTGLIALVDLLFFRRARKAKSRKDPTLIEYCRSFFPVLLIVWVIRSFLIQPYKVPTGSLEPTVMPGDFIAVNQFAYGLKFPIGNRTMISIGEPQRGDIVLFHYPPDPAVIYVKRLIGKPGDKIEYKNKILYINGKEQPQRLLSHDFDYGDGPGQTAPVDVYEENLNGVRHKIFRRPGSTDGSFSMQSDALGDFSYTVPADTYFMMGDNRDNSADSRYFGAVPERNIIGKAFGVWMSWDPVHYRIRWDRLGNSLLPQQKSVETTQTQK